MSSDRIIIGAPPGRPGRPTGGVPEVASGSVRRSPVRSEVRSSRGAALDRVFDSISEITEGLLECPVEVVEHVGYLVGEAALTVANSLRCDRLAVLEAAAGSDPSQGSRGSAGEFEELAESPGGSPRSVSVHLSTSGEELSLAPDEPVGSPPKKVRRSLSAESPSASSQHAAASEGQEGDCTIEGGA